MVKWRYFKFVIAEVLINEKYINKVDEEAVDIEKHGDLQ